MESYNWNKLAEITGNSYNFVQDNLSKSRKNVIRGLHFQKPPYPQTKLVSCIRGAIIDVVVDLRKDSPTYKYHWNFELSSDNGRMLLVPQGFAHGFLTIEDDTIVSYKVDNYYHPETDGGINWLSDLGINWPIGIEDAIISPKDEELPFFTNEAFEL